jgi:hypothetical protein
MLEQYILLTQLTKYRIDGPAQALFPAGTHIGRHLLRTGKHVKVAHLSVRFMFRP